MKLVNICKNKTQHFNLKKNLKKPFNKAGMKRYSIFFQETSSHIFLLEEY